MKPESSRAIAVIATVASLPFRGECPVSGVEAVLRLPGNLANHTGRRCDLVLLLASHPGRMPIAPGAFHEDSPRPAVAGLGDGATPDRIPRRMLGRDEPEIRHQLAWGLKAGQVADPRQEHGRRDQIEAAYRPQLRHRLEQRPVRHRDADCRPQPRDALLRLAY